jgi:thiol:disulfide interchange protein
MQRLQRFLAIPMAASAIACLWLLNRQVGGPALVVGIAAAVLLLGLCALIGSRQRQGRNGRIAAGAAALAATVAAILLVPSQTADARRTVEGAEPWSDARLASYVDQRKPVFVYFTADWCLTCKVNEAAAIDRKEVRDAFRKGDVQVLAGDWTNGDPAITRFIESRGRAGVPLYLWYASGKPVEELPQVLTPAMLISRAQSVRR